MIREHIDKNSGAILFKKDPDSLRYEELLEKVKKYEDTIPHLEKSISKLTKKLTSLEKSLENSKE